MEQKKMTYLHGWWELNSGIIHRFILQTDDVFKIHFLWVL